MLTVVAQDIAKIANASISVELIIIAIKELLACFGQDTAKERLQAMSQRERVRLTRRRLKQTLRQEEADIPTFDELTAIAEAMVDSMLNSDEEVVAACYAE